MSASTNHSHLDAAALARMGQEDPWVMYLVLRRSAAASSLESLKASAAACVAVQQDWADHPDWVANFEAWWEGSFRKIALSAKEAQWNRLTQELDCSVVCDEQGEPLLAAFPPRLRSQREPLLAKLQAYSPDLELTPADTVPPDETHSTLLVLSLDAQMSQGKAMAQVGHAALMYWSLLSESPSREPHRWLLALADAHQWELLRSEPRCVVVRDAGLTEVASGTETVMALRPDSPVVRQAALRLASIPL